MSAAPPKTSDPEATPRAEAFPPISLPRASDAVTAALIDGIRAGAAPIGTYLPRDQDLATHFGVSRAVVREAMDRLRRAGILEDRRGNRGGAIVRSLTIPTDLSDIAHGAARGAPGRAARGSANGRNGVRATRSAPGDRERPPRAR